MPQRNVATNFTFEQQRQEINLLAADFWSHKTATDTAASTYLKHDGSNDFTGQTLAVPNAFTINANSGSGTVTISGNLDVTGTTTTVNSANLEVTDKNILIAKGSTSDAQADGAGITIDSGTDITFNFVDAKDALVSSIGLEGTTFLKAPYGQFTGNGTPSTGQGIEINAPDANTGQIISYDRPNTAYKELRVKGSSVGIYGGTSNALVGSFSSTGLDVTGTVTTTGQITGKSSNTDKYVRMYGSAGTGRWDIYGHGANLRFSDNDTAGSVVFDQNVDANGGLDVTGNITASGDITVSHAGLAVNEFESTDNHSRLRINSGSSSYAQLEFGDQDDVDAGEIRYSNTANNQDYMAFHVGNNVEHMRLTQDGLLELLGVQRFQAYDNAGGGGGYNATGLVIGNAYDAGKTGLSDDRNAIIWQERGLDLDFATQDTYRMKLTYDGRLLLGTQSTTDHKLSTSNNPLFQLESADSNDYGRMSLIYNGSNGVGPGFWFAKSRGTTIGSNVGVADGDQLGGFFFHAADGDDKYGRAAAIVCYADGTQGTNVTPGKLEFSTTQSGAAATTARMVIHNDGYITAPSQVGFAARMTSNLAHPGNNSFNSTGWVMPFDDEVWDIGGNFNVSNYTFTAPVAGRYLCCYTIQLETITNWLWMYIYPVVTGTGGTTNTSATSAAGVVFSDMAGTGVTGTSTTTAAYQTISNTIVMNLTAGQQVRLGTRGQIDATIKSGAETQWTMQLLG